VPIEIGETHSIANQGRNLAARRVGRRALWHRRAKVRLRRCPSGGLRGNAVVLRLFPQL
jgi:hypothetical protein